MFHPLSNRRKRREGGGREGEDEGVREGRREGKREEGIEPRVSHILIGKCWATELYLHSLTIT